MATPLERSLLTAIAVFRWATWVWMAVVLAVDVRNAVGVEVSSSAAMDQELTGVVVVALALVVTAGATVLVRVDPGRLLSPAPLVAELALGGLVIGLDPWVYASDHSQVLGSSWVLAGIFSAGVAFAGRGGLLAGAWIGLCRVAGLVMWSDGAWDGDRWQSAASAVVLYALAGGVAGFAAIKLREAEQEIAVARARDEVARELHDGVLQTLAVVQRRADDDELASLARDQERDLRDFLAGAASSPGELAVELRRAAARFERRHGVRAQVILAEDLPAPDDHVAVALVGAVAEGLANAGKHGHASRVTVYVEPTDGGLFCSIKDDGGGFDADATPEGTGIGGSIRDRLDEVGGRAEIDGRAGSGTEVRIWVPCRP